MGGEHLPLRKHKSTSQPSSKQGRWHVCETSPVRHTLSGRGAVTSGSRSTQSPFLQARRPRTEPASRDSVSPRVPDWALLVAGPAAGHAQQRDSCVEVIPGGATSKPESLPPPLPQTLKTTRQTTLKKSFSASTGQVWVSPLGKDREG